MNTEMAREMIRKYSKEKLEGNKISGYEHSERVYKLARRIGGLQNDDVVYAASYLHDIAFTEPHNKIAAANAERLMRQMRYSDKDIENAKDAILNHITDGEPETDDGIAVHDANQLENLGAIGVVRICWLGKDSSKVTSISDLVKVLKNYRERCYGSLISERGKMLASEKLKVMDAFIAALEKELEC
ncbi:MAG: HD domain-containing protein [Thermoplasmata archaeon]